MAAIGKRSTLAVTRESVHGFYLDGLELGEILLPGRQAPTGTVVGTPLDVFLYRDSEDRLVATTATPLVMTGEFAALHVVSINPQIGAFLDWGLPKDLLLPFREQREPVFVGDTVVVYVQVDAKSDRIMATTRVNRHLSRETPPYAAGQPVSVIVSGRTPLGYSAIIENTHLGLLYHANISAPLEIGQKFTAFVSAVRPDGKVDLRLDASGYQRVASLTEQILEALRQGGGSLALDDTSPPEVIRSAFGVSKKAFKQAIGALYKSRLIRFESPGICLIETADRPKEKK